MAYLTRLFPNLRSYHVRDALRNPYQMHRNLMAAFPDVGADTPARSHFKVLHRLDVVPDPLTRSPRPAVLVQSAVEPDWLRLHHDDNGASWTERFNTKPFNPTPEWFARADVVRFRLRANPSKRLHRRSTDADGNRVDAHAIGKRVEIRSPEQQHQWLVRQGAHHGFELVQVRAQPDTEAPVFDVADKPEGKAIARKPDGKNNVITITHAAVLFEGFLRVRNACDLVDALLNGIGPAKAFGFGLLSLAPVR